MNMSYTRAKLVYASIITSFRVSIYRNYSEPSHAHSQNRTILVLSRCYAANFAHMCGVALFEPPWEQENLLLTCEHDASAFLFSVVLRITVTIQNHPTHIRKTARYSCFPAALQLILLICVGVALFEPPWEQENLLLTCEHDASAFLFSVVLNSYYWLYNNN